MTQISMYEAARETYIQETRPEWSYELRWWLFGFRNLRDSTKNHIRCSMRYIKELMP